MTLTSDIDALGNGEDSALTRPFWEATARGQLVRPVCHACGCNFFTPSLVCPECQSDDWTYQLSVGTGRVYSHTTVHRGPDATWTVPYVLAVIDLDEGWTMLSRLVVTPPDESTPGGLIGLAVRVTFVAEDRPPFRTLPMFEPIAEST